MKTCRKGLHQYEDSNSQCPECNRLSHQMYYKANKLKNTERVRKCKKDYYLKHRELLIARAKAWYHNNKGG